MKLTLLAPAKLNLTLDILGRTPDNYHQLDSVMLAVDLCDTLTLARCGEGVRLSCDDPSLEVEDNLVLKATRALFAHIGINPGGLALTLEKRIPSQAGLGGGSANAAATLVGLNQLYAARLSESELSQLGLSVGADVPFCLQGGCARAQGKGEILTPLPRPAGVFVIAKPPQSMSTHRAFELYDRAGVEHAPRTSEMIAALRCKDLAGVGKAMSNAFEQVLDVPEARTIKQIMLECGALGAALTGSGSAVAGLFESEAIAANCTQRLKNSAQFVQVVRPV